MSLRIFILVFFLLLFQSTEAQQLWGITGGSPSYGLWSNTINCWCPQCTDAEFIAPCQFNVDQGCTVTPNGNLYAMDDYNDIFFINTTNGASSLLIDLPHTNNTFDLIGLASISNTIFYSVNRVTTPDTLYQIDVTNGNLVNLGALDHTMYNLGELTFFQGDIYYIVGPGGKGIARIKLTTPLTNDYLCDIPVSYTPHPLTASTQCHCLISMDAGTEQYMIINTLDGDVTLVGNNIYFQYGLTSHLEHEQPDCVTSLDLDCNNSSGAEDYDYNTTDFYCISDEGVAVADYDILFLYDTLVERMTIELTGTLPDGNNEYLEIEETYPNLTITGSGTQTILMESDGAASSTQFKAALREIRYHNSSFIPTLGTRIVRVNANTYYGTATNEAIAFIDVSEWPAYDVELGQDLQLCDEEVVMLNTQVEDADYLWSTNETTQSISVSDPGTYSVTVTGDEFCPAIDSIEISVVPNVFVELGNDIVVCEGEEANIEVEVQSSLPLTIEITVSPGNPLIYTGVISDIEIPVFVTEFTSYVINSVTATLPACITIGDEEQIVDVIPSYNDTVANEICEGDSLLIGNDWIHNPGIYTENATTFFGCDSIVTHHVSFSSSISVFQEINTCIVADTGTFFQLIDNPVGCDTLLETHVQLGLLDTTFLFTTTCQTGQEGIFSNILTSIDGCDSVVVNTVTLLAPIDTTWLNNSSCDSSALGVVQNMFVNQEGCDSLVITTISFGSPDTTLLFTTSCDSSSLGVFEETYQNQSSCDSVVITTINYSAQDLTFLSSNSCNPSDTGTFVSEYTNSFGCDSIVTTTISLFPENETFITSSTCDPLAAGVFVYDLTNQYGCDSIVTETVNLLPSDNTFLSATTCSNSEAGVFITSHINQYGCDSIVTLTVALIPSDTTVLSFKTCDPFQVGIIESAFTNQEGCDSLVIEQTTLYPLPQLQLEITSDYNGFAISCAGQSDGSVNANTSGTPPFQYLWSTSSSDPNISGLSAGSYAVTVTDGNGCIASSEVVLFEPEEFSISFIVSHPDCFDNLEGSISVEQRGGVEPIRYSIDAVNYQPSPVFDQLSGGTYTITALDANDCEAKEIIWINVPLMVNVELPDDQVPFPGDTVIIQAVVNVPFDSLAKVEWSGVVNSPCPNCLTQPVAPIITTTYSVTVTTHDGCMDEDAVTLYLENSNDVYVPNVFSPNGDGVNDVLVISAGAGVEEISEFVVFDRWGNVVYYDEHFTPNDPARAWDGKMKGRPLNPGVFVYKMIVHVVDGTTNSFYGNITIVR